MPTPCPRLGGITESNYWHSSVCLALCLFICVESYLPLVLSLCPPYMGLCICLLLVLIWSFVCLWILMSSPAKQGGGLFVQALVSTQSSLCSPPSPIPHPVSHFLSTSLSLPPFLPSFLICRFHPLFLLFLMHISLENTCCLSYVQTCSDPATFPPSSSSFVRSFFFSKNVDTHCALILIKLIDSTCNSSSCIHYRDHDFLCCD